MTTIRLAIIMIFTGIFSLANAQDVLTFEQAVRQALENNYAIRLEMNSAEIDENNVSIGNAGFLPRLDGAANQDFSVVNTQQEYLTGEERAVDGARSRSLVAGAVLSWTVFDGMRMFATYDQLQLLDDRAQLEVQQQMENTIANVAAVYYQIAFLQKNIYAIEEALQLSDRILRLAEDRRDIGTASGLEVMQTQVLVNAVKAALLDQQEQLNSAKIRLNQLMAVPLNTDLQVVDSFTVSDRYQLADMLTESMNQNPQLLITRKNTEIARKDLQIVKAEYWPEVALNLGYNYTNSQAESGFLLMNQSRGLNYGISANINLFNGFNTNRRRQNTAIAIEGLQLQEEALQQELQSELMVAYNIYQNNLQKLELERSNIVVARQNIDISIEKERLGDIAGIELREAQQNFLLAQNRLLIAEYRAKLAEIELLRLSGQLLQIERVGVE